MTFLAGQFKLLESKIPCTVQVARDGDIAGLGRVFTAWRANPPDVQSAARHITDSLDLPSRLKGIVSTAIDLASEPNNNIFHGNRHFMEVFAMSAVLAQHAYDRGRIETHERGLLLAAALIHDYRHDGTTNAGTPYRLEKIAVDGAETALRTAGADDRDMAVIRAFVYTTDISKDFSNPAAISPAESVKSYSLTKNPADLKPELARLQDLRLADAALMLADADLGGGMISTTLNIQGGLYLAQEQGRPYDHKGQVFFLDKICHRSAFSEAGRALVQPHLDAVLKDFGLAAPAPGRPSLTA